MARTDRLANLEALLRRAGPTTSEALAVELGVSRRTVLRDIATLRERGVPIDGDAGPGGGLRLDLQRARAPLYLGVTDVAALWLAATLSRSASTLPWGNAARSAMHKLAASLPPATSKRLKALCRRVIIGPPATAATCEDLGATSSELLHTFEEAFGRGIGLAFDYVDRQGRTTPRRVEPHALLVQPPVWYILARDLAKDEARMFRMDRISRPRLLSTVTFVPDVAKVLDPELPADRFRPLL